MANIIRREGNQFLSLRDAMDRLFDESFLRPFGDSSGWPIVGAPAVDVAETNDALVVTATVPGAKPEDIKVTLIGDVLQIAGEVKDESEQDEATYHVRERRFGSFSRQIALPVPVMSDKVQAEFEHGVLKLTMPKAEEAKPKSIKLTVKQ